MSRKFIRFNYALIASKIQITRPKSATPSISAAAIIIDVLISPNASGFLPLASIAEPANLPIPNAAPITTRPAPIPAAKYANAKFVIS